MFLGFIILGWLTDSERFGGGVKYIIYGGHVGFKRLPMGMQPLTDCWFDKRGVMKPKSLVDMKPSQQSKGFLKRGHLPRGSG